MHKKSNKKRCYKILLTATSAIALLLTSAGLSSAADIVELVRQCDVCHGKDGVSTTPDVPTIAGFSHEGFLNTMDVFRENERIALPFQVPGEPETVMNDVARELSDDDVEALSAYYSQRPFVVAIQSFDEEQARRGEIIHKDKCDKCHPDNGAEPVEDSAILAGQWTPYLKRQFDNILTGKRLVPRSMYRRITKLSAAEIDALLHFYAKSGLSRSLPTVTSQ